MHAHRMPLLPHYCWCHGEEGCCRLLAAAHQCLMGSIVPPPTSA
jgi:hypothetical protein